MNWNRSEGSICKASGGEVEEEEEEEEYICMHLSLQNSK
jgi:hypothetical protein